MGSSSTTPRCACRSSSRRADGHRARASSPSRCGAVDIAPTIADAGWDLQAAACRRRREPACRCSRRTRARVPVSLAESWYPRLHFGWSELRRRASASGSTSPRRSPSSTICATDPAEQTQLDRRSRRRRRAAGRGRSAAERVTRASAAGARPAAQPDAATIERLQALGYVGTLRAGDAGAAGDNPRDRIAEYRAYRELFTARSALLGARPSGGGGAAPAEAGEAERARVRGAPLSRKRVRRAVKRDAALGEYDVAGAAESRIAADAALRGGEGPRPRSGEPRGGRRARQHGPGAWSRARSTATTRSASSISGPGSGRRRSTRSRSAVEINDARPARAREPRAGPPCGPATASVARTQFERMIALGLSGRARRTSTSASSPPRRGDARGSRAPLPARARGGPGVRSRRRDALARRPEAMTRRMRSLALGLVLLVVSGCLYVVAARRPVEAPVRAAAARAAAAPACAPIRPQRRRSSRSTPRAGIGSAPTASAPPRRRTWIGWRARACCSSRRSRRRR